MTTDLQLKDEEILEKSLSNPKYFEILVSRYQKAFLRKTTSVLKSKEEAEDVVQDTFLKIYKYGDKFRDVSGASFKSWAYEILRNTTYSQYRKEKRHLLNVKSVDFSVYDIEDQSISSQIEMMEKNERISYIEKITSLMPKSLAQVLRLTFLEHRTQTEIAEIEKISKEAVRVRIHRAKDLFKNIITNNI